MLYFYETADTIQMLMLLISFVISVLL